MKYFIRFFWILLVIVFFKFQPFSISGISNIVYNDFTDSLETGNSYQPIAVVGDLQRTSIWEMMLGREQNDPERQVIINQVSSENPSLLILLGDMVFDGSSEDQWRYFDNLLDTVKHIPVLPVVGNHEYYGGDSSTALKNVRQRFSQFKENTWYSRVKDNVAFIFLDSNEPRLTGFQWKEQRLWFESMIRTYEEDPLIKGILVFIHHPPYTNSIVTGDEKNIQDTFLETFYQSEKTLAIFSGHAHTYEHFKKEGKSFVVSGGGGAPRVIIKKGTDCHEDECTLQGVRPFHYILLQPRDNSIGVIVKGLDKKTRKFFIVDDFEMEYRNPVLAKN